MNYIYMDHAATTPIHPDVLKTMHVIDQEVFGNPSSIHAYGRKARHYIDEARRTMDESINALENEVIFTSGGTEANNLALVGVALANQHKGDHIITTEIEHHATIHAVKYLEQLGFRVTYVPVSEQGKIAVHDIMNALTQETIL